MSCHNKNPKRILHVVNIMDRAGIETTLMNYYRNIDHTEFQFDFLTHRPNAGVYDEEIKQLGGQIFNAPRLYPQNYLKYFRYMKKFFKDHPEYDMIHSHIDTMSFFPLLAAKLSKVPVRIAHSHTTKLDKDSKYPIKWGCKVLLKYVTTHRIACGKEAGDFLFKKEKFKIIRNCIDAEKFKYDATKRETLLKEHGFENKLVLGHVGRFTKLKNHLFLIEVFKEVSQKIDAALILVGSGEELDHIKTVVNQSEDIKHKVLFIEESSKVNDIMQMFDIFCLPSMYEGVPVVGIEAQFSGVKCIFSDNVPNEVDISNHSDFVPLIKNQWVDACLNQEQGKKYDISNHSYDIKMGVKELLDLYR